MLQEEWFFVTVNPVMNLENLNKKQQKYLDLQNGET